MEKQTIATINLGNLKFTVSLGGFKKITSKGDGLMHSHATFELHILLKGQARLSIEDKTISLNQNDSVLLYPDTFHLFEEQGMDSSILSFSFSVERGSQKTDIDHYSMFINQIKQGNGFMVIKQNMLISDYTGKILSNLYLRNAFSGNIINALLTLLFSELIMPFYSKESPPDNAETEMSECDSRIYMIEHYINEYYMEDISLKKLSTLLSLSEKQTNRMIKKAFGTEFRECLCKIRMKNAQKFLRQTDMDIKDIAEAIGYQSYNGFYLAFKNRFGITPLEYRQNKRTHPNT